MRRLGRAIIVAVGLLVLFGAVSPTKTPASTCSGTTSVDDVSFVDVPTSVVDGVTRNVGVDLGFADERASGAIQLVLRSTANKALSHPYAVSIASASTVDYKERVVSVPLTLTSADGPAQLALTYLDLLSGCSYTLLSRVIRAGAEQVTVPTPRRTNDDRGVTFNPDTSFCGTKTLRVSATLAGSSAAVSGAGCHLPRGTRVGPAGLRISVYDGTVQIRLHPRKPGIKTVRYTVSYGAKVVRRGSFRIKATYRPGQKGYRIYRSDFDDFVNVCINEGHKLYAANGQLYCFITGFSSYWVTHVDRVS